jgi:hypothetical protein
MTKAEKELLLKDLCARLPYGVKCDIGYYNPYTLCRLNIDKENDGIKLDLTDYKDEINVQLYLSDEKPYLFPLSSMDEEMKNFLKWKLTTPKYDSFDEESLEDLLNSNMQIVHYCYEHYLDINGLIERDLALEAPAGMYN